MVSIMALSYKNNSFDVILNKLRDIRYAGGEQLYGFNNTIDVQLQFNADRTQIALQADIFAREILLHRSKFDMKRFLGQYQDDWLRLLHEAYVYDRIKCIYYGFSYNNILTIPENLIAFPGNIILFRMLSKRQFSFQTSDIQPYSLYVSINTTLDRSSILEPIFEWYPSLREGMSENDSFPSYVNSRSESILQGLLNAKRYLDNSKSGNQSEQLYDIKQLGDSSVNAFTLNDSNPILNSFLSSDGNKFFFINPVSVSGPGKLRFNESLYLSRAIGLRRDQLEFNGNTFYSVVPRNTISDPLTREEVYAVTGLKSEIIPYGSEQINAYLGINSYTPSTGVSNVTFTSSTP